MERMLRSPMARAASVGLVVAVASALPMLTRSNVAPEVPAPRYLALGTP